MNMKPKGIQSGIGIIEFMREQGELTEDEATVERHRHLAEVYNLATCDCEKCSSSAKSADEK